MKFSATTLLPLLVSVGSAVPVGMAKRQQNLDLDILQFALTLEHLENVYYKQALQRFTKADFEQAGFQGSYFDNMLFIVQDEEKHVQLLNGAITAAGRRPVAACTYNFGITDVNSFATLSTVLEGVGTSAYLGGAPLLQDKNILTTAGAILVTEALHYSQQREPTGLVPAANDLGTPLDANSVFTLASGFIVQCPADNEPLPFKANPTLTLNPDGCPPPSGQVLFKRDGHSSSSSNTNSAELLGPVVLPSSAAPGATPEQLQAAQQQVNAQIQNNVIGGGQGKVTAARPCPFLTTDAAATFTAQNEIPQGAFVTWVSGLSVISSQTNVAGAQAATRVPAGVAGQCYAFITNRQITDNKLDPAAIVAGPAIVEVQPQAPTIDFGVL